MPETYIGHIKTPQDALTIFEACRRGQLQRVKRRLSTKERINNIQSGSIFAFDESEAGMRRWTDGRTWSPSRVLGSFLTYRELDTKRRPRRHANRSSNGDLVNGGGAGICSYKPNGLIKQSFSICTVNNQKMHLISYYTKADVVNGRLTTPSMDPNLNKIAIPKGMYPELNPLDTSGGHSATLHLMMKNATNFTLKHQKPTSDSRTCSSSSTNKSVIGCPPSLSSSPLSTCSDDDILSPSYTSLSFSSHYHLATSPYGRQPSSPVLTQPPCLSTSAQVWKPYSLQSEDTRQLEALKSQLRI